MKGRIIKKRKCIRRIQKNEGKVMRIKKDGRKGGEGGLRKKRISIVIKKEKQEDEGGTVEGLRKGFS